jgi:hypothetical protein
LSEQSDAASTLIALAQCVDDLFLNAAHRTVVGTFALSCLNDPNQSRVGALQIPADPTESIDDQESDTPLTLGQRALLIVALHDVYCPDAEEKALSIREFTVDEALTDLVEFGRCTRWDEIRRRVRALGNYSLYWFKRHYSRIEMHLASEFTPPGGDSGTAPRHNRPRGRRPLAQTDPQKWQVYLQIGRALDQFRGTKKALEKLKIRPEYQQLRERIKELDLKLNSDLIESARSAIRRHDADVIR